MLPAMERLDREVGVKMRGHRDHNQFNVVIRQEIGKIGIGLAVEPVLRLFPPRFERFADCGDREVLWHFLNDIGVQPPSGSPESGNADLDYAIRTLVHDFHVLPVSTPKRHIRHGYCS
jgi:hypothetical protein